MARQGPGLACVRYEKLHRRLIYEPGNFGDSDNALSYQPEISSAAGPFWAECAFLGGKIRVVENQTQRRIKSIQIEVVQSDSFGRNPSEPRTYFRQEVVEHIECRERCPDGGFLIADVINEMQSRREIDRDVTAFCLGRERRTQQRCKNRFSVEIHVEYSDAGQS